MSEKICSENQENEQTLINFLCDDNHFNNENYKLREHELELLKTTEFWVFGYGSLVWKVDFPYEENKTGYICGYLRRFYQNSIDHRGTAKKPGRVVTLVPSSDPKTKVHGMAYKIPDSKKIEVIKHLDFREQNGYQRHLVDFYPIARNELEPKKFHKMFIYVATKDNESYAGPTDTPQQLAKQIYEATGKSGTNREYVYKLADAMRQFFPQENDEHLFELETCLKELES